MVSACYQRRQGRVEGGGRLQYRRLKVKGRCCKRCYGGTARDLGGDDGSLDHSHAEGEGGETNGSTLSGTCDDENQMDGKGDHIIGEG